jgi:hypothetical protein
LKLIKEDEKAFHVHDGVQTHRIAKSAISPELQQRIRGFADGGGIEESNRLAQERNVYRSKEAGPGGTVKLEPLEEPPAQPPVEAMTPRPARPAPMNYADPDAGTRRSASAPPRAGMADGWTVDAPDGGAEHGESIEIRTPRGHVVTIGGNDAGTPRADEGVAKRIAASDAAGPVAATQWPYAGQSPMSGAGSDTPAMPLAQAQGALASQRPPIPSLRPAGVPSTPKPPQPPPAQAAAPRAPSGPDPYATREEAVNNAIKDTLQQQGANAVTESNEKSTAMSQALLDSYGLDAQAKEMALTHQRKLDQAEQDYKSAVAEYSRSEIDPQRFWNSRTTGQKVLAVLGTFFGGLPGGTNQALGIIKDAQDRDFEAQKADLEKAKGKVGMVHNLLGVMRERFGDETTAQAATKAAMWQDTKNKIDMFTAKHAGTQQEAQYRLLGQQADLEQVKHEQAAAVQAKVHADDEANKAGELRVRERLAKVAESKAGNTGNAQAISDEAIRKAANEWADAYGTGVPFSAEAEQRGKDLGAIVLGARGARPNDEQIEKFLSPYTGPIQKAKMRDPAYRQAVANRLAEGAIRARDTKVKSGTAADDTGE